MVLFKPGDVPLTWGGLGGPPCVLFQTAVFKTQQNCPTQNSLDWSLPKPGPKKPLLQHLPFPVV